MKIIITSIFFLFAFLAQAQIPDTALVRIEIDSLISLNDSLVKDRKLDEALKTMEKAQEKCLKFFGDQTALYGAVAYKIGVVYYYKGDYSNIIPYWLDVKDIREKVLGKEHPSYMTNLNNLGSVYNRLGQFEKSEPYFLEAKQLREKTLGKEHPDYATSLCNLGVLYNKMGKSEKAEAFYLEGKVILEKALGKEHEDYAWCIDLLGSLYLEMGKYEKVEPYFLEAKQIYEMIVGKEHPDYAGSLYNLGALFTYQGRYEKAEPYFLEARQIFELVAGKEHPQYATILNNLGALYIKMGEYGKAETFFLESKQIREKTLGKENHYYTYNLNNLGVLYKKMGLYQKAETFYLEAKQIREKTLSKEHPDYAGSLYNLGNLYSDMELYQKAETFYLEAKQIQGKTLGKEHPDYAANLNTLGVLYKKMGLYQKAETFYLEAKQIQEKVLDKEHPDYAASLNNLGDLYRHLVKYKKAETFFLKAKQIREKVIGKQHPDYASSLNNLGNIYMVKGEIKKAIPFYLKANDIRKTHLLKATLHLSERDLLGYVKTFNKNQNRILSVASLDKGATGSAYDNSLFYKGFLLSAIQRVKQLAKSDSMSYDLFLRLKGYNRRLSIAYALPIAEQDSSSIAVLEEKANNVEKKLARSVAGFGEANKQVQWQDVQSTLKPTEASIEFIHYNLHNPDKTDTVLYAALLLLPEGEPKLISLFEEQEIRTLLASHQDRRSDYVNDLYALAERGATVLGQSKKSLYNLIWEPLETHLEGITKIYYSPSGLLHRINLAAIPLSDEQSLCDQYNLVQVNSTRQLVIPHQTMSTANSALLMGGIDYDIDTLSVTPSDSLTIDDLVSRSEFGFENAGSTLRGGSWNYLKYTKKEVNNIGELLSSNGYQTAVQTHTSGSEEIFRQNTQAKSSPRILHLATHGFFFPDPDKKDRVRDESDPVFKTSDHPMIRSGLVLAGGNHVWQGNTAIHGKEDGILTAYEISQMDLSNTELVVLSACETGLGDIEGNEGVYGLQRAFKIAGVKYLVMSLWQIPDRETKDFMVRFYEHLLEDKMSIPDAFRLTQKEMKERFYNPYQWAGFVLVE